MSRIFPFSIVTPDCSAALLLGTHFFFFLAVTDTAFEEQFRALLSFLLVGEAGRTSLYLHASLFSKSTMWLDNHMNPKSLILICIGYVLGAAVIIHTDTGYNASVPSKRKSVAHTAWEWL